jgi:ATP-dependent Clp endopeptidase proteolytic subunit ClpP
MGNHMSENLNTEDPEIKAAVLKKLAAETRHETALAKQIEAQGDYNRLQVEVEDRGVRERYADDRYNHVYRFVKPVDDRSVEDAICRLTVWHRMDPGCDMEIVFNSPGGNVFDGMDLFDYIQELRRDGHYVMTGTRGMAASMAGILLQAGDHRVMGAEARILIHQVSSMAFGKIGEIEDEVKLMKDMGDRVLNIFARRCAEAAENGTAATPLSKAQLRRGWERKDWWIDSDDALRFGLVDEVR